MKEKVVVKERKKLVYCTGDIVVDQKVGVDGGGRRLFQGLS